MDGIVFTLEYKNLVRNMKLHFGDGVLSYWEVISVLEFRMEEDKWQESWSSVES